MNSIYIGDRPLDPPEDDECETCGGHGAVGNILNAEPCHALTAATTPTPANQTKSQTYE